MSTPKTKQTTEATGKYAGKKMMQTDAMVTPRPCDAVTDTGKISFWSRVKFFIQLRDGLWSIPLFAVIFYTVGLIIHYVFGYQWMFYDPAFLQPAFGAVGVVLIAVNGVVFIIYFYFRVLHRYWFGKHLPDEQIVVNYSKDDWKNIEGWQRVLFLLGVVFGLLYAIVRVYLAMK